jgi:signal transduction histidine kinase
MRRLAKRKSERNPRGVTAEPRSTVDTDVRERVQRVSTGQDPSSRRIPAGTLTKHEPVVSAPRDIVALQQLVRKLETRWSEQQALIDQLGHDLKNPLSPVFLELGRLVTLTSRPADAPPPEILRERVRAVEDRLRTYLARLERTVAALRLDSLDAGRNDLPSEPLDLVQLVRAVAEDMRSELDSAGSRLNIVADGPVRGVWDRKPVEHMVAELLSNVIRGGAATIDVRIAADGSDAVLAVRNRSTGPSTADAMGLRLLEKLCAAMGGRIATEDSSGKAFILKLPRHAAR